MYVLEAQSCSCKSGPNLVGESENKKFAIYHEKASPDSKDPQNIVANQSDFERDLTSHDRTYLEPDERTLLGPANGRHLLPYLLQLTSLTLDTVLEKSHLLIVHSLLLLCISQLPSRNLC